MKISIFTLGCKTNYYESCQMAKLLTQQGHTVSMDIVYADIFIINTCAITAEAERKSRQAISRARRRNEHCRVIVVGCASEHNSQQFADIDAVSFVKGTHGKVNIADIIDKVGVEVESLPAVYGNNISALQSKARAFVKIQDGCNNYCSYCIVPYLRGRSRSRAIEDIVDEIDGITASEIVLIGIDISQYGVDIGVDLTQLLLALRSVKARIRLGSFEASAVTPQFIDALRQINWCPQLHLSLQSGSNSVLERMNRRYTREAYFYAVTRVKDVGANVAVTCDIIVGFCNETDEEFAQTMEFVRSCRFADIHIFPYSAREGTVAYAWGDDVAPDTKKSRCKALNVVKNDSIRNFLQCSIGLNASVIAESCDGKYWKGYSENYITVYWQGKFQVGQVVQVVLLSIYKDGLFAEVI